jgi:hypothetical protein
MLTRTALHIPCLRRGFVFCCGHAHQAAALAGAQAVLAACRWVKEKERCLENEAKIMKDVRLPLPYTVLWGDYPRFLLC